MKVAVASDHRGYDNKRQLLAYLQKKGYAVVDLGCDGLNACDYPDYAIPAARSIATGQADAAVLLDSSGIGMSVCANKIKGIRAAVVHDEMMARVARDANHCNVLCLGVDLLPTDQIIKITLTFLTTAFSQGRHARRVEKISLLEQTL
jgi:ribose 5-phosphate isomerase B